MTEQPTLTPPSDGAPAKTYSAVKWPDGITPLC